MIACQCQLIQKMSSAQGILGQFLFSFYILPVQCVQCKRRPQHGRLLQLLSAFSGGSFILSLSHPLGRRTTRLEPGWVNTLRWPGRTRRRPGRSPRRPRPWRRRRRLRCLWCGRPHSSAPSSSPCCSAPSSCGACPATWPPAWRRPPPTPPRRSPLPGPAPLKCDSTSGAF